MINAEDWETAENYLHKAVKLDNKHAQARYLLAVVDEQEGEYHRAKRFYRKATKLDSNHMDAYIGWARMAEKTDDDSQAMAAFGRALKIEPDSAEIHYQLGRMYLKNKSVKAQKYLLKAHALDANHRPALEGLVRLYKIKHHPTKAKKYQRRLAALDSGGAPQSRAPASIGRYNNNDRATEVGESIAPRSYPRPPRKKIRVIVLDFLVKAGGAEEELGTGIAAMLITALQKTGRYTVIENESMIDVVGQQDFGQSGRMARSSGPRLGRIKGAQLLIKGVVTEFSDRVQEGRSGIAFQGIGLGSSSAKAVVGVDIRIIDAETGEILESAHRKAEVKSGGMSLAGSFKGISLEHENFKKTPLGQATRKLIVRLVDHIGALY